MRRVLAGLLVMAAVCALGGATPVLARCGFGSPIVQGIGVGGGPLGGIVSTTDVLKALADSA